MNGKRLFRRADRFPAGGYRGVMVASSDVPGTNGTLIKIIKADAINSEWFWSYAEKIPFHTCWEWSGVRDAKGYGAYHQLGGRARAHRVAWALTHGDTPADLMVCHNCDNPGCVRPDHLFLGTVKENLEDCSRKGRVRNMLAEVHAAQTHCKRGHPLSGENLIEKRMRGGYLGRSCRRCSRASKIRYEQRKRAERTHEEVR